MFYLPDALWRDYNFSFLFNHWKVYKFAFPETGSLYRIHQRCFLYFVSFLVENCGRINLLLLQKIFVPAGFSVYFFISDESGPTFSNKYCVITR